MTSPTERSRSRFRQVRLATVFISIFIFSGFAVAQDKSNTAAAAKATPASEIKVSQIRLFPAEVVFSDPREYRKVVVLGKTEEAGEFDLSRDAAFAPADDCVKWDEKGFLYPVRDCQTKVDVSARGLKATVPVTVRGLDQPHPISFVRDVEPILNKVGCTAGTCHGAAKGKNGFKLSLRGYDPEFDYDRLIHDLSGRRLNRADPARSLMLLKPTAEVPHVGGQRFDLESRYHQTILAWLSAGVPFGDAKAAQVKQLEVAPSEILMPKPGLSQQMAVIAHFADGTARDVTREASYTSNTPSIAEVTQEGLLQSSRK